MNWTAIEVQKRRQSTIEELMQFLAAQESAREHPPKKQKLDIRGHVLERIQEQRLTAKELSVNVLRLGPTAVTQWLARTKKGEAGSPKTELRLRGWLSGEC